MSRAGLLEEDNVLDIGLVNEDSVSEQLSKLEESKRKTKMLLMCFGFMVFFGLGNKIFQILMLQTMYNYPLYLSNFTTFVYIPLSFLYILPMLYWGSAITPEMTALPKSAFFYIGALDCIAGFMQTLSINKIQNGTLVVILSQASIPVSMIISKYMLGVQYRKSQYFGCIVVFCGLAAVLLPTLLLKKADDDCGPSSLTLGVSILVLVLSNIPMCLSTVVKEKTLGEAAVDPMYLNGWVGVFQFIMGIPLTFISAPSEGIKFGFMPVINNLVDGAKCYVGINSKIDPKKVKKVADAMQFLSDQYMSTETSVVEPSSNYLFNDFSGQLMNAGANSLSSLKGCEDEEVFDNCRMAPVYANAYIFFNFGYNLLIILILKYGSANLLWIAMTIMVPLSSVAFALPFMPNNKPLKFYVVIGLLVILAGIITFRFFTNIRQAIWGKSLADLAEEQQSLIENERNVNNAGSSVISDEYMEPISPGSFSTRDAYIPPSLDYYNEADIAVNVDVNATLKPKKSKKNAKK